MCLALLKIPHRRTSVVNLALFVGPRDWGSIAKLISRKWCLMYALFLSVIILHFWCLVSCQTRLIRNKTAVSLWEITAYEIFWCYVKLANRKLNRCDFITNYSLYNWVLNAQQGFAFIWYHWTQGCCLPCVAALSTQRFWLKLTH